MSGVNKVILVGNLGNDPETRFLTNGDAVTNITIATSESWKDKNTGQKQEKTEWHKVVFFRKLAEVAGEYLRKGSKVYIEGKLQTRMWEKDGQKHYSTEIVANEMQMLDSRTASDNQGQDARLGQQAPQKPNQAATSFQAPDDGFSQDVPF